MNWSLAVVAPLVGAAASLATLVAASSRTGAPVGRTIYSILLFSTALLLVWLSAFLGGSQLLHYPGFQSAVVVALLVFGPAIVLLSVSLGRGACAISSGGTAAVVLATIASLVFGIWIVGVAEPSSLQVREDGSFLLALAPGPARATAVGLLLAGCFAIARFQAAMEAARRAGVSPLARALVGPLFATVALVLTTSQLLLYGALPLEVVAVGSLVVVPTTLVTWPALIGPNRSKAALPQSARIQTSGLLLLGLGLFLVSLAALGQVVHEFFPERGLLWFRYGGTAVLLAFAVLSLVPSVRGPLSDYFDRSLYAQRWDFRHEWHRANRACAPAPSLLVLVQRAREFLDEILGPTAVAVWVPQEQTGGWVAVNSGSVELRPLRPENPLRVEVAAQTDVVELLVERPHRFQDIPSVVENLSLIEDGGFRIFIGLRQENECFSVLGLAPPEGFRLDREHRVLLRNFSGQFSNTLWAQLRMVTPEASGGEDG